MVASNSVTRFDRLREEVRSKHVCGMCGKPGAVIKRFDNYNRIFWLHKGCNRKYLKWVKEQTIA